MKTKELRDNSVDELRTEEQRLRREIFDLTFKHGTRQLLDTASIGRNKRDLARVLTVIGEKSKS